MWGDFSSACWETLSWTFWWQAHPGAHWQRSCSGRILISLSTQIITSSFHQSPSPPSPPSSIFQSDEQFNRELKRQQEKQSNNRLHAAVSATVFGARRSRHYSSDVVNFIAHGISSNTVLTFWFLTDLLTRLDYAAGGDKECQMIPKWLPAMNFIFNCLLLHTMPLHRL